ncbi:helix-turn-helix transcriptional regulator [Aeoliella mucimassa]|uniref:MarR family protein n=1 Tax=Aeoliella mucimassa TaxID=2527972 RepID=A0A518ASA0_9BACT|nr:helix-turn-helix domain-containing protein [Aeoliella mucimassa]QDU57597.1 MarR family protein [Aeoliella mucimassa]
MNTPSNHPAAETTPGPRWTFLTNHAHVLLELKTHPDMVLREVAIRVGITERAVQRIVQELEEEGFLERQRVGRRNQYRVMLDKHLRHPIESHCTIAELLSLVANDSNKVSQS